MDLTATTLCKENNLPVVVFDMDTYGNLRKVIEGEDIGTLIHCRKHLKFFTIFVCSYCDKSNKG